MPQFKKLVGLANAALHDFGVGLWLVFLIAKATTYFPSWPVYIVGITFSVLPDLDILLAMVLSKFGFKSEHHRDLLHYPLVVIPSVTVLVGITAYGQGGRWLFFSLLALTCLLAHFIHDSTGEANGCGVQWLAPIDKRFYRLFHRSIVEVVPLSIVQKYYHITVDDWLQKYYLHPSPESVIGWCLFSSGLVVVFVTR